MEKCIGVVGRGAMGMGMAKSLRRAGYTVHAAIPLPASPLLVLSLLSDVD